MNTLDTRALSAALLRVSLGVMFFAHGFILKVLVFTPAGTAKFFQSIGLPGPLAYATIAAETLGGIALILGVQTRLVAAGLIPVLIGATTVHVGNGWVFNAPGGGWEYPVFLIVMAAAVALQGAGAYALDNLRLRKAVTA